MKRLTGGRWTPVALVPIVAVLIGGSAYALASNGGSGTITACVHKQGGALYVARKCGKGDKKLTWNEVGRASCRERVSKQV